MKESRVFSGDVGSLDPRELFAFKIMELLDMGPKSFFLIKPESSSSSGAKICYIITLDVAYSDDKNVTKTFITDNYYKNGEMDEEKIEEIKLIKNFWQGALSN